MNKAKPEDVNFQPAEFRITVILADYAQNFPNTVVKITKDTEASNVRSLNATSATPHLFYSNMSNL